MNDCFVVECVLVCVFGLLFGWFGLFFAFVFLVCEWLIVSPSFDCCCLLCFACFALSLFDGFVLSVSLPGCSPHLWLVALLT